MSARTIVRCIQMRYVLTLAGFAIVGTPIVVSGTPRAAAAVTASPAVLVFGKVPVGTTGVQLLTITNVGTEDLFWAALSYNPPFNADVANSQCYTLDRIVPGASCTISVTLSPTRPGPYSSSLQAQFNLYNDRSFVATTVTVQGTGRGCKGGGNSCN